MLDRMARFALVGLQLFLALTAMYGALLVVPGLPREWLSGTPFPDYTIPALALGVVIGGGALVSAAMLAIREPLGVLLSLAVGTAICVFEVVETTVVGWDVWLHVVGLKSTGGDTLAGLDASGVPTLMGVPLPLWLQPFYFVFGLILIVLALRLWTHGVQPQLHLRRVGA